MADIYLGVSGSEILLPIRYFYGTPIGAQEVAINKQIQEREMSDGTIRYAMFQNKRVFDISWGYLSKINLDIIKSLQVLNIALRFQNNNVDDTWYNVIIISFSYRPVDPLITALGYYDCQLILREV